MMLAFAGALFVQAANGRTTTYDCEAFGRTFEASKHEGLSAPRNGLGFQITVMHALCGGWTVIDVWSTIDRRELVWHARRHQMDRNGRLTTATLDSLACPALDTAVRKLSDVRLTLGVMDPEPMSRSGPPPRPPAPPAADGPWFGLRMDAHQVDRSTTLISAESDQGPLADWMIHEVFPLEACWRPTP